nr:hypothetical protein [Tanacetum cinerariifolium]
MYLEAKSLELKALSEQALKSQLHSELKKRRIGLTEIPIATGFSRVGLTRLISKLDNSYRVRLNRVKNLVTQQCYQVELWNNSMRYDKWHPQGPLCALICRRARYEAGLYESINVSDMIEDGN